MLGDAVVDIIALAAQLLRTSNANPIWEGVWEVSENVREGWDNRVLGRGVLKLLSKDSGTFRTYTPNLV